MSRLFDVTAMIPVTVRVKAQDADKAKRIAARTRVVLVESKGVVVGAIGFADSIEVKEVEPGDVPVK